MWCMLCIHTMASFQQAGHANHMIIVVFTWNQHLNVTKCICKALIEGAACIVLTRFFKIHVLAVIKTYSKQVWFKSDETCDLYYSVTVYLCFDLVTPVTCILISNSCKISTVGRYPSLNSLKYCWNNFRNLDDNWTINVVFTVFPFNFTKYLNCPGPVLSSYKIIINTYILGKFDDNPIKM